MRTPDGKRGWGRTPLFRRTPPPLQTGITRPPLLDIVGAFPLDILLPRDILGGSLPPLDILDGVSLVIRGLQRACAECV